MSKKEIEIMDVSREQRQDSVANFAAKLKEFISAYEQNREKARQDGKLSEFIRDRDNFNVALFVSNIGAFLHTLPLDIDSLDADAAMKKELKPKTEEIKRKIQSEIDLISHDFLPLLYKYGLESEETKRLKNLCDMLSELATQAKTALLELQKVAV